MLWKIFLTIMQYRDRAFRCMIMSGLRKFFTMDESHFPGWDINWFQVSIVVICNHLQKKFYEDLGDFFCGLRKKNLFAQQSITNTCLLIPA